MNINYNMRRGKIDAEYKLPTLEQIRDMVVKDFKNPLISYGRKAIDSLISRLLSMRTASTNLLNGKFDDEISMLTGRAQDDLKGQSNDNKEFSNGLILDIDRVTNLILEELNKPIT